jgi:hypothetical protein
MSRETNYPGIEGIAVGITTQRDKWPRKIEGTIKVPLKTKGKISAFELKKLN